jgi:hypothetical protein
LATIQTELYNWVTLPVTLPAWNTNPHHFGVLKAEADAREYQPFPGASLNQRQRTPRWGGRSFYKVRA